MEILIILLLLMKDEKSKEKLSPVISALLRDKDVMNALLSSLGQSEGEKREEAKPREEKTAPEEDGSGEKSEAIEKFLNSYFR